MPIIIVHRPGAYMNKLRKYNVFLDDQLIGNIADGETKEFPVTAGDHTLVFKIDWTSCQPAHFSIAENENKHFEVTPFKSAAWLLPILFVLSLACIVVSNFFDTLYLIGFTSIVSLILLYFLTIGRKKYLVAKQVVSKRL